jgi:hypothetical protein
MMSKRIDKSSQWVSFEGCLVAYFGIGLLEYPEIGEKYIGCVVYTELSVHALSTLYCRNYAAQDGFYLERFIT